MSLLVVATYPQAAGPVLEGEAHLERGGGVTVAGHRISPSQGTPAMLGAACQVADHLALPAPYALLGGDIGRGNGTRDVFHRLRAVLEEVRPTVVAFHYMQPIMGIMLSALDDIRATVPEALLVADAGGMYAARALGLARHFELMTPDVGEIGFLADPEVSHPAHVSRYLFGTDEFDAGMLAAEAWRTGGSSRVLLVKGRTDTIAVEGEAVHTIDAPDVPALEAIGGTGDTVTGMACGFLSAGFPTVDAAICACLANREAGRVVGVTPATRSSEIVAALPAVFRDNLCAWAGVCSA